MRCTEYFRRLVREPGWRNTSAVFADALRSILPAPCFARPFVCSGLPEACSVILVGENPATTTDVDWWSFWSDETGFDYARWHSLYREARRKRGKQELSQTRRRIERLRDAGVDCFETNAFMNERLDGHGRGDTNVHVLELAIHRLPRVRTLVAHGKDARTCLRSIEIPARIRLIETKHFRLLSYKAVDELAEQIRGLDEERASRT